jgi:hypothetical protein
MNLNNNNLNYNKYGNYNSLGNSYNNLSDIKLQYLNDNNNSINKSLSQQNLA